METSDFGMTQCKDHSLEGDGAPGGKVIYQPVGSQGGRTDTDCALDSSNFQVGFSQSRVSLPALLELDPLLPSEEDPGIIHSTPEPILIGTSIPSKGKHSSMRAPSSVDGSEGIVLSDPLSLQPPQSSSSKPSIIKRGPGRPRKDSVTGNTIRLPSGHKIKNLGVRSRKKADVTNPVGGSNLSLISAGDLSVGESPPRGAEDTAESDTSSVASSLEKLHEDFASFPEQWPGKLCAICGLGERSMLGQGDLLRLDISESFDPLSACKGLTSQSKNEKESAVDRCLKPGLFARRQKGASKIKRLVSQGSLESMNEPIDEVCGYQEEPDYCTIFERSSGFYFIHFNCAKWSTGVERLAEEGYKNLEFEVVKALNQRCQHCGNLGASLVCKADGCSAQLHFPCAALSGAFQDSKNRTLLCASHVEISTHLIEEAAICTVCDTQGDVSSLLMCSSCGRHYHGTCMALNSDPAIRAGWQCPACKVCQACRQPGDESKLLACDTCDKTYHIFCLRPALSSIPKHSWKCKMCRMCTDCGARTPGSGPSSRWHANFSVCDSCYQQRNKGLACPLCGKAYRHVAQKQMLQCHLCKKFVHGACDPSADLAMYEQKRALYPDYEFVCIPCKAGGSGLNTLGGHPKVLGAPKKDELDEGLHSAGVTPSNDSFLSVEDDSFPFTESSSDITWMEKNISNTFEDVSSVTINLNKQLIKDKISPNKKKLMPIKIKQVEKGGLLASQNNGRKNRMNEFTKKRGPKPKLRIFGSNRVGINRNSNESYHKGVEEPGVENRMVLCSARDDYVLQQDVCVMCGAFGNDQEGRLLSCAQCGQCYHPYCVNIKVTKVVLLKGWRCLDCTVCEGCGQRNDESRLILCDECDVSFHIYCIEPPLEQVPHGSWKCKWCAVCQHCGSNSPGYNSSWHDNYTKCGPCASQSLCPVCTEEYTEGDLIIKCFHCERWLHSSCDMIKDCDDAEKCADEGYFCVLCRPSDVLPPHLQPPVPADIVKLESPPKSPDPPTKVPSQFSLDGICLSEYGMSQIRSLSLDMPRKKRRKAGNIAELEAGILAAIESVVSGGDDNPFGNDAYRPEEMNEKEKDAKKRQKNLQKLGIGGFLVRLRGPRFKDEDEPLELLSGINDGDKPKRKAPKRKSRNKLVELFPVYLQEAFFGKGLMEPIKDSPLVEECDTTEPAVNLDVENTIRLTNEEILEIQKIKASQKQTEPNKINHLPAKGSNSTDTKEAVKLTNLNPMALRGDGSTMLNDILPISGDLLDQDLVDTIIIQKNEVKAPNGLSELHRTTRGSQIQVNRNVDDDRQKDEFTDFLSSQFNLESMESGLPSMDSKDVEDIFKGVLVEERHESLFAVTTGASGTVPPQRRAPTLSLKTGVVTAASGSTPIISSTISQPSPVPGSSISRTVPIQQNLASPLSFPPPSPYHSEYSNSPQFSPAFSEPPSPWPAPAEDSDQPSSYNQRSILKWEADESLGHFATISAVLYANINHPELKREYTNWAERTKQIAKIWRGLPSEKRAPYLQKARENRAASRLQKAQQMPKDIRCGGSSKKEMAQVASPEGPQTSPKRSCSPDITAGRRGDSSSSNDTSATNFSCHAPASYLQRSVQTPPIEPLIGIAYSPSNAVSSQACGNYLQNMYASPGTPSPKSGLPANHHNHLKESNIKFPFGDQSIKVLTPSEIMRSLPDLKQEDCNYALGMDQDKLLCGGTPKTPRIETAEERQWKQMQALRQLPPQQLSHQDSSMKGVKEFEDSTTAMHRTTPQPQFSPSGSTGTGMVQKSATSTNNVPMTQLSDISSQQLQVTTSELLEQKFPSLSSPRVPTQVPRFPPQPVRPPTTSTDMPPPVPSLPFIRKPLPSSQAAAIRSPNVVRSIPVSPRHTSIGKNENYGNSSPESNDSQSQGFSDSDKPSIPDKNIYNQSGSIGKDTADGRLPSSPQCQETRQHLRDLLQRQKKLEDPPTSSELPSGQLHPSWSNADEWQKIGASDANATVRHQVPNSPQAQGMNVNQFRHPFLPPQVRSQVTIAGTPPVNRAGEYRMSLASSVQPGDARARLLLNQPRTMMNPMQQNMSRPQTFIGSPGKPFQQIRNSLDPYGHLVVPQQRLQGPGISSASQSMLAQQLGRPLSSLPSIHSNDNAHSTQLSQQQPIQSSNHNSMPETNVVSSPLPSDHQELPDSVTAELEKLEQEQHDESNVDAESGELADLGMDDDELLGMGADFNILEYADPELDQAVGGEKTNILDNLDLEEETKDVNKDLKRKDDSERSTSKKEGIEYSSTGKPIKSRVSPKPADHPNVQSTTVMMSPSKPNYSQDSRPLDGGASSLLRPNQPPPPYPGPPPPYPGRPQMGIRNGCGVNIPSVVAMGLGVKNSVAGFISGQPLPPQLPSPSMHANSNPHMSLHQRRTLLLQEQPLLLEDLLEQEKREQLRQGSGLIGTGPEEPLLSDFDFERLKADVLSSSTLPVSLSPPNAVAQSTMVMSNQPPGISSRNQSGEWQTEPDPNIRRTDRQALDPKSMHPGIASMGPSSTGTNPRLPVYPLQSLPPPPNPPEHPATEQERQMQIQYEQWLYSQQQVLSMHLKCFETEVHKLRKVKKSLNSKQRQLRKNGNELTENDAAELDRIGKELPVLQKQLDQARKQSRQHNLLIQDYRNKQQKRQQMMGMSPGSQGGTPQGPSQGSPHACASSSPLLSKPQSPMLSPSPSMGPSPSPLMQNSPMASPLTPSPGPISNSLSQTSPRGGVNQNVHGVEEMAYSPSSDGPGRTMMSQNPANRIQGQHHMSQMRMGSPNVPLNQIMISQAATMNMGNNPGNSGIMMARGMNSNLMSMQQQRPMMESQCGMQRMRALGPHDQMRNMNPMGQRFQRMGMNQEHMMRSRPPPNFSNPSQMTMSSGVQHFNPVRIPFPNQSPTGSSLGNVRSPSPLSTGGLGSPPANQMMMGQNRVSPASSPMRRPSGSGSIGSASPMAERPQSVENPMTPRPTGSRPHTPIGPGGLCQNMEGLNPQLHHHHSPMENHHFNQADNFGLKNLDNQSTHSLQNFLSNNQEFGLGLGPEYNSPNVNSGGGGSNQQTLPFPTFSFFDGPYKLGLKGGNPSPVIHDHPACASNSVVEQTPVSAIDSTQLAVIQDHNTQDSGAGVNNSSGVSNSITAGHETAHNLPNCVQSDSAPQEPCTTARCPTQVVTVRNEEFRTKTEHLPLVVPLRDSGGQGEIKLKNAIPPQDANIAVPTSGGCATACKSENIGNLSIKESEPANDNPNPSTSSKLAPTLDYVSSNLTIVLEPLVQTNDLDTCPKATITKNETGSSDLEGKSSDTALVCNSNSVIGLTPVSAINSTPLAASQDPSTQDVVAHFNKPSISTNSIDDGHERAYNLPNCVQSDSAPQEPCTTARCPTQVVPVRNEEFRSKAEHLPLVVPLRDTSLCSGQGCEEVKLKNLIPPQDANIAIPTSGGCATVFKSENIGNLSLKEPQPANDNHNPITSSNLAPTVGYVSSNLTTVSKPFMQNTDLDTCPKGSIIKDETASSVLEKQSSDSILVCNSVPRLNEVMVKSENNRILKITNLTPLTSMGTSSNPPFTASSIMQSILAQPHRPGPVLISTHSGVTNVTTVTSSISSHLISQASTGESQNALLKQLLQNTGCASTAQTSENSGFSLTSCLNSRPVNTISHLSEQATRIPQPAPTARPPDAPVSPVLSQPSKVESIEALEISEEPPIPEIRPSTTASLPLLKAVSVDLVSQNTPDESEGNSRTGSITPTLFMEEESSKNDSFDKPPFDSKIVDSQKSDEEVKKARKRQYQSKRKQTVSSGKESVSPKKRPKKAVKPEEDFDVFIENLMTTLRQLPPVGIVEPDLGHNLGVRSVFGCGDLSKINTKGYNSRHGDLTGGFGRSMETNFSDYYNAKPYGRESSRPRAKTSPIHRGFYNQEFATPRHASSDKGVSGEQRLPTPIRESDTPDTIVSSSSPELDCRGSPDLFPGLKLIETDEDKKQHLRDSPTIPILIPIPIRPLLSAKLGKVLNDYDKENSISATKTRSSIPFKENGNITVTLTLSATAVDEIRGVLRNLANILGISPPSYQLHEKTGSPPDKTFLTYKTKDGKEAVDIQSILNGTAKFCKHCDVLVLNNIIRKKVRDLPGVGPELESTDEHCFCSANCFMQFTMTRGIGGSIDKTPSVVKHISDAKDIKIEKAGAVKEKVVLGKTSAQPNTSVDKIKIKIEPGSVPLNVQSHLQGEDESDKLPVKKWKMIRYKSWSCNAPLPGKYKKPTDKELTEMLFRLGITVVPSKLPDDTRRCTFCHQIGDGVSDGPGRLLNYDVDKWIHLNCALWSDEVYETENGALVNVDVAIKQSLGLNCIICKHSGASVKCFKVRCTSVYHCGCAVKDGCGFYKNKTVFCPAHIPKGEKENELTSLSVFRRVYVQRDENRQVAVVMHHVDQQHLLRVGSLIFLNVGQLLPHQLQAFHTGNYIYPVGYKIVRFYWSMTRVNKRCQYICSIHEVDGRPEFRITAQEEGSKERVIKSGTAQGAWHQVLDTISKLRNAHDAIKVFPRYITGEDLFGLTEPAIVKVLESLPGIETLSDYHFKYGRNPLLELPLAINPSGCARSEPKLRTHFKRPHTQRTGASRASLPSSLLSSSEAACPYSKQFVHSKSSQYKKMKQEWRNNVYLARSKIQGLGLYAARDIERHTMVIEYIGEIIRNELAEAREKKYESQNRGIYMFRMDEERVIDATLCGGLARYINHSCNPNCVAETVEVDRDVRIIIFANRRISRGEELAYDYKFEVEDDQHKIPCLCGAPNCQQWMN